MNKHRGLRCILVVALASSVAHEARADGLPVAKPHEIGLSAERLEAITNYLEGEVRAKRIAGAVALIARHGRVGYLKVRSLFKPSHLVLPF